MMPTVDPNRIHWEAVARDEPTDWAGLATEPHGIQDQLVEDPAGLWLTPADASIGPVILAVHGGGFVSGSATTHRRMFGHLARAAGVRVFAVEYGLDPECVFPSQLNVVTTAYRRLIEGGAAGVAVTGDSCGAGLALALALRARDQGFSPPASLLLMSAWTDLEATGASYDRNSDPFFTREVVQALGAGYLAGADPHNPYAAAAHADVRGLPQTYLQVGAEEALLEDSRQLATRMREAGVDVRLEEFPDQLHTFQMAAGRAATAIDAIERGGTWLRSTLVS